ncbi:hypothetical protein FHH43_05845 [Clostridium perfringens]|nr:hypothetical protein [Clostridium perfringens]
MQQKNGLIDVDTLYINVYKKDCRTNKEILPNNKNFVCFVDYNSTEKTVLKDGGLPKSTWNKLHHEVIGKFEIAWGEGHYYTRQATKIWRNTSCPCGSGKKYKRCCGN